MSGRGFTLVELLVASLLALAVGAVAAAVARPAAELVAMAPSAGELTARGRVVLARLARDIRGAGAAAALASPASAASWPALLPVIDAGAVVGLTVVHVAWGAATGRLAEGASGAGLLVLAGAPHCTGRGATCGFEAGDDVLVADGTAALAFVRLSSVQDGPVRLVPDAPLGSSFGAGAWVAAVERITYATAPAGGAFQLTRAVNGGAGQPVADEVVSLRFVLAGDASPPMLGADGRRATYGSPPPPPGVDDPRDGWGPGESCLFAVDEDGRQVPRLAALGPPETLVAMAPGMLADGPWCPDASHPDAFDADLLRVRRVDVALRLRAVEAGLRPPEPGQTGAVRQVWVPDFGTRLSVAPRWGSR
jgi:hypothetical protein